MWSAVTETAGTEQALEQTRNFRWGAVPADRRAFRTRALTVDPPLGPLAKFTGVFHGFGLNTIFRPQDFAVTPTELPVQPDPNATPPNIDDNILEINLTEETLSFSKPLGSVPNRGMVQGDMFLNGVPYLQTINDINEPADPIGIHLEPGVWLSVPDTTVPAEPASFVRMASIPHGTTIEAQGTSFTVPSGPLFQPVDITPTLLSSGQKIRFTSQDVTNPGTFRLPQDLSQFVAAGTITQDILDNPNLLLEQRAKAQNIVSTDVITIDTDPAAPLFGGGTDNIAFLLGDANATSPNANAARMSAIFWVEVVSEQITVPPCKAGHSVVVRGSDAAGDPVASFLVTSESTTTADTPLEVTYTQIQYVQTVLLVFNGLVWPHVSVATLVPDGSIPVTLPTSPSL
jgi:hypothetical protein